MEIGNYKIGDVVKDFKGSIWGDSTFEVVGFDGNDYCQILLTNVVGKFYDSGKPWRCNINAKTARLVDANSRPLSKVDRRKLIVMMNKGIVEAKREFMIRINKNNQYGKDKS